MCVAWGGGRGAEGGGAFPLASNARMARWSESSWSKDMLRPATCRLNDRACDLQVRVRVQCLPVSTRITPQCLFASYSRSLRESFLPPVEAEGAMYASEAVLGVGGEELLASVLLDGRREHLVVSAAKKLLGDSDTDLEEDELAEEEEELPFRLDLVSFSFSVAVGLPPPPLPLPRELLHEALLEEEEDEDLWAVAVPPTDPESSVAGGDAPVPALLSAEKSWKLAGRMEEEASPEEEDEVVSPPTPPAVML